MKAIVYTSKTGHTAEYAKIIGEKMNLSVYSLKDAKKRIKEKTEILYLGWLFASHIKGYKKANAKYNIRAVCAVGLCDTGALLAEVRNVNKIPENIPLFTLQGGMDRSKLRGIHKWMIQMLQKGLSAQAQRSESEERMLCLLAQDANYVSEENLSALMKWYDENSGK